MINLDVTEKSIKELLEANEVDKVVQGCNCFHTMVGTVAETLKDVTHNDIFMLDSSTSPYGDINKLGTWTEGNYTIYEKEVDIYNLYVQYTLSARDCNTIHWASAHDGIYEILEKSESGQIVAIQNFSCDSSSYNDFMNTVEQLINDYDDELPDVDIVVFNH